MSVIKNSKYGYFISHKALIDEIYSDIDCPLSNHRLKCELFNITSPYKPPKNKQLKVDDEDPFTSEVQHVRELYESFYPEIRQIFNEENFEVRNSAAVKTATEIYEESGKVLIEDSHGANPNDPITQTIKNTKFLFPRNCKFYAKDVNEIDRYLNEKYDLIVLDPPWWNKYIRRKRKHSEHGYDMMYNEDLKKLPLENLLGNDGLIVVWCTNSNQHLSTLRDEIFPKWNVKYLGKWYWLKVTKSGVPICEFSQPPRKQPFEQIIFAGRKETKIEFDKLVVSVPSALHSHKPPLIRLVEPHLGDSPNCLEIFARYLLPNFTSYGKEVLRFQHESLYE